MLSLYMLLCLFLITNAADVDVTANICQNCNNSDIVECSKENLTRISQLFKCLEEDIPCTLAIVSQNFMCLIKSGNDSEFFNTDNYEAFADQILSTSSEDTSLQMTDSTLPVEDYVNDDSYQATTIESATERKIIRNDYTNFTCYSCDNHMYPDCGTNPKRTIKCNKFENVTLGCYLSETYSNYTGMWSVQRDCMQRLNFEEFMESCSNEDFCRYCLTPNCNNWSLSSFGIAQQHVSYILILLVVLHLI